MTIYSLGEDRPQMDESAYAADSATIIGKVTLSKDASVWPQAVLRGDNGERIEIGARSNIQDGAVLHTDPGFTLSIGEDVSVGHQAMLHGCTVGDGSLIGVQAVILNGASIGKNSLVAAGAVVTERKVSATTRLAPRRGRPPCPRPVGFGQHLYGRSTSAGWRRERSLRNCATSLTIDWSETAWRQRDRSTTRSTLRECSDQPERTSAE